MAAGDTLGMAAARTTRDTAASGLLTPARHVCMPQIKGKVRAGTRRAEEFRDGLRVERGDEDDARA
jgi:hypothetical protein